MGAYDDALTEALKEQGDLLKQRAEIDKRLLHLKQTIATLFRLTGAALPNAIINRGMTDAVRDFLDFVAKQGTGQWVSAKDVKDNLEGVGYDFSAYKNSIASVNGTLQRLVDGDELEKRKIRNDDGSWVTKYRLKSNALAEGQEGKK